MLDTILELAVPARFQQVGALRRATDAFLHDSTNDHLRHSLLLVVSELCTNAIEALQNSDAELKVRVRDLPETVILEVEDTGPGFGSTPYRPPSNEGLDERGRGLHVVRNLVDDVSVDRSYGRTTVRCTVAK
jgi:anti-sigma regulatory factor (Ser/Thr protein kinase)